MPNCDKRVYGLWYQMLRRCYDTTQHEREKGKSYADCEVCDGWKMLSCFAKDIKNITKKANEANQTKYVLEANGVTLLFDSEKSACEFLGVKKCSVSSCYHKGYKCKGYRISKMDEEA